MHPLLQRQIRKYLGATNEAELLKMMDSMDPEFKDRISKFLASIDSTYQDVDRNTFITNRSVEVSTQELSEANHSLRLEIKKNQQIVNNLIETAQILSADNRINFQNLDAEELAKRIASLAEENKIIQENFRIAKIESENANRAKSEFLANMSHEIRTPLNAVIGFTDILIKSDMNLEQKQYMQIVFRSANSLLDLLNDILDFSKIEAGKLELEIQKTDIFDLISQAADVINVKANSKGIEILLNIPLSLPKYIWTDSIRLRQILINLLGNAVKFTDSGEIEIKVEQINFDKDKKESSLLFSVRDTGTGISEENLSKIFNAFSQADTSITRKYGGTGLGLSISNSLLNLMKSKLNVKSEIGKGSTFYFNLNVPAEASSKIPELKFRKIKNALVVIGNKNNQLIVQTILSELQIESNAVSNVSEAKELIKANKKYDLAIIDYLLSEEQGIEIVQFIRNSMKISSSDLPILLYYTASDNISNFQAIQKLSIHGTFLKPILPKQLIEAIFEIETGSRQELEEDEIINHINKEFLKQKPKILIVDDEQVNRLLVQKMIKQLLPNAMIVDAANGIQAVEINLKEKPDLIFMDMQMPEMNGYEATQEIRKKEEGYVPIIALTAGTVRGEIDRCFEVGMDDYASKPVLKNTIEKLIYKWLPMKEDSVT